MKQRKHLFGPLIMGAACILPVLLVLLFSIGSGWRFPGLLPVPFSANLWRELLSGDNGIGSSFWLTLVLATLTAAIATTTGFFASRQIAEHRHRRQLVMLAYLPFVLSPVVFGLSVKHYFIRLGLAGGPFGVLLALLLIAFPYCTIFFIGFWSRRTAQYAELARTLGAGDGTVLRRVLLPLARPQLFVCFFQCFLLAWFEYGLTSVIGFGKVQTLTVKVYQYITEANPFQAAVCACLLVAPPVLLLWVNKRIIFRQAN